MNIHKAEKPFTMYLYEGSLPHRSDLLVPHRKDHYLIVFTRKATGVRQWIDMQPYVLKDQTVYFTGPDNVIMKEDASLLWSTGMAFTSDFLTLAGTSLSGLPLLQNLQNVHELNLNEADLLFMEEVLNRLQLEYENPGEWQQKMILANLSLLLTYLSRMYTEQYGKGVSAEKAFLKKYQAFIDQHFKKWHEVNNYADLLHVSAGHLGEVIKMQSGRPAIKHIHNRLVLEAKRLLVHSEQTSKEIAFDLGFADSSYFNRFFKRETGQTPTGYRSGIRKMYQ